MKFPLTEVPDKKKTAVGVRGMKLAESDVIEEVFYINGADDVIITHQEKEISLSSLRTGKRDTKGSKKG